MYKHFKEVHLHEDLATVGGIALATAIAAAFTAIMQHSNANAIESKLLSCHDDDYLVLSLADSNVNVESVLSTFLKRSKLMKRLVKRNEITLINNMETARLLKQFFPDYPIFKILFKNSEIDYANGKQFYAKHQDLFKIFGDLRSNTAITWDGILRSIATFGMSKNIDTSKISECAKANLYYLALVMRQILVYKDDIKRMQFKGRYIEVRQNYNQG
jgi:hypothetical protein